MKGPVAAKHNIKRMDRLLGNTAMQIEESFRDLKSLQYGMGLRHSKARYSVITRFAGDHYSLVDQPVCPTLKLATKVPGKYNKRPCCAVDN